MRKSIKSIAGLLVAAIVSTTTLFAQDMDREHARNQLKDILTEEQLAMMAENRENTRALREAFKATLSEEQLAILQDTELGMKERREALKATLSDDQLALMEGNREAIQAQKEAFRATLTDEQKEAMKTQAREGNRHMKKKAKMGQKGAGPSDS